MELRIKNDSCDAGVGWQLYYRLRIDSKRLCITGTIVDAAASCKVCIFLFFLTKFRTVLLYKNQSTNVFANELTGF